MKKIGVYLTNKTLPRPNHFLKIQWEIHFLTFLNIDRNAPKKKFRTVNMYDFKRKLLSKSILDLGKCPNQKTHESESACFLVWALPEVQN